MTVTEAAQYAGVSKALMHRWIQGELSKGNTEIYEPGIRGSEDTAGRVSVAFAKRMREDRRRRVEREVRRLGGRVTWPKD